MPNELRPKRVAVIAVHGVADQQPESTSKAVADLLAHTTHCDAFQQSPLRLEVKPVPLGARLTREESKQAESAERWAWKQKSETATPRRKGDGPPLDAGDAAHQYMREQLDGYREVAPDEATYETVRLVSQSKDANGGGTGSLDTEVHVFEMYWADLSRFAGIGYHIFIELYQLLFYLCGLGRKTLEMAQREDGLGGWWTVLLWSRAAAERLLVLAVPIFNLFVLATASVALPLWLCVDRSDAQVALMVKALAATLAAGLGGFGVYSWQLRQGRSAAWWFALALVPVGAAAGAWWVVASGATLPWLMGLWGLLAGAAVFWIMLQYQRRQPGAIYFTVGAGVVFLAVYGYEIVWRGRAGNATAMLNGVLRAVEDQCLLLGIAWFLLIAAAMLATVSGLLARLGLPRQPSGLWFRAVRALWTGDLTLVLPTLLVLMINLSLWQAVAVTVVPSPPKTHEKIDVRQGRNDKVGGEPKTESLILDQLLGPAGSPGKWERLWTGRYEPNHWFFQRNPPPVRDLREEASQMVEQRTPAGYAWICGAFFVAALWMAWCLAPAVGTEGRPPSPEREVSIWQGETLTLAFARMRWAGEVVRLLVVVALPVSYVWTLAHAKGPISDPTKAAALWAGAVVALGVIASRGWFRFLAFGLRSALDIALDVTNWLRLHPRRENPRARICARFHSLLRYVCEWRDSRDQGPYDGLIIIAHSQGTVITADLLRFLQREAAANPAIKPSRLGAADFPVYLFTMGCPLRQLYSLRFPQLYDWARHPALPATAWPGDRPRPADLGLRQWVNAYRSGDYVGRYVWWPENWPETYDPTLPPKTDPTLCVSEFCIGSGAHLNYWDNHGQRIGEQLDALIRSV